MTIDEQIEQLKTAVSAASDSELARKLQIDRRTVSGWRSRNSIPKRYLSILDGQSKDFVGCAPLHWGEYEQAAFEAALFRFGNFYKRHYENPEFSQLMTDFPFAAASFWALMGSTQKEIARNMERGDHVNLHAATAMIYHADISQPDEAHSRDAAILEWHNATEDE